MKTKNIIPIISFLLLALVGCGKNIVEPLNSETTVEAPKEAPKRELTSLMSLPGSVSRQVYPSREKFIDLSKKEFAIFNDKQIVRFTTKEPLTTPPVVEYTIAKQPSGVNEVILTILEKADSKTVTSPGAFRVEGVILDDNRFSVTIPMKTPDDYPANFFLGDIPLGGWGKPPEKEQIPESEMQE
jgi:hypothetical protein